jgi:hypothetical protein
MAYAKIPKHPVQFERLAERFHVVFYSDPSLRYFLEQGFQLRPPMNSRPTKYLAPCLTQLLVDARPCNDSLSERNVTRVCSTTDSGTLTRIPASDTSRISAHATFSFPRRSRQLT